MKTYCCKTKARFSNLVRHLLVKLSDYVVLLPRKLPAVANGGQGVGMKSIDKESVTFFQCRVQLGD